MALIKASELGEYVYCHRAWWLHQVCGEQPVGQARRDRGTVLHRRHGAAVWGSQLLLIAGGLLLLAAVLALALR